jgi:hypothetical protein
MKRILLISSLIAASTAAFAQANKTGAAAAPAAAAPAASTTPARAQPASIAREQAMPVTKNAFAEEVKGYNALLEANKHVEAKDKWNDVNRMMMLSLRDCQLKMNAATEAKNEGEKKAIMERMTKQRTLFGNITQLKQTDMVANKAQINEKLNEFMSTIQQ